MTMQDGHDVDIPTLLPIGNGISHAKLIEVHTQRYPDTYYSPGYLIPQFPPECIIVNVLLHRCCAAQIN